MSSTGESFKRIDGDEVMIHDKPEWYKRGARIEKDAIRSPS